MTEIRAFIAVSFPPHLQDHLEQVSRLVRDDLAGVPVRWVPVKNMHLTLKFLGNIPESSLDALRNVLREEAALHPAFKISLGDLGAFPNVKRPRVIWIGIIASQELKSLAMGIGHATESIGFPSEERPFSPHLTFGRVGRQITAEDLHRIGEVVLTIKPGPPEWTDVNEIHLYRSDLQPGGALYSRLYSAPLA
jgi:RNA 2',3'-cyclic 3'-phosphodiesterase